MLPASGDWNPKTARCDTGGGGRRRPGTCVEEDAVAIVEFYEALADADFADILRLERVDFDSHLGGEGGNVGLVDPHETWRARAAVAAGGAFEAEAVLVPRLVGLGGRL
jgi:hypothetical protein